MSSLKYSVEIEYMASGLDNASKPLAKLKGASDGWEKSMTQSVGSVMSDLASGFNSVFDTAASLFVTSMTAAAGAVGIAVAESLKEGFAANKYMEDLTTGIAGSMSMAIGGDFEANFRKADESADHLRKLAITLPGEFKDAANAFSYILPSGLSHGVSTQRLEHMAAYGVGAAATLGVPQNVAGRELASMLEHRASDRMPLYAKMLGSQLSAKDFNKLSFDKRFELIENKFSRLGPAMDRFGGSYSGLSTAATDQAKNVGRTFAGPLFGFVKQSLTDGLAWFANNEVEVHAFAANLGQSVRDALVWGRDELIHWVPIAWRFGQTIHHGLVGAFQKVEPYLDKFGRIAQHFMEDSGPLEKIEKVAGLMVALRAGSGGLGLAGALLGDVGGMAKTLGELGIGFGEVLLVAGPLAIALGVFGAAVEGAAHVLTDPTNALHGPAVDMVKDIGEAGKPAGENLLRMAKTLQPIADVLGTTMLASISGTVAMFSAATEAGTLFTQAITGAANAEIFLMDKIRAMAGVMHNDPAMVIEHPFDPMPIKNINTATAERETEAIKPPSIVNHNTFQVKIEVNGNEDPDRVAKTVFTSLTNMARYPTTTQTTGDRIRDARSY